MDKVLEKLFDEIRSIKPKNSKQYIFDDASEGIRSRDVSEEREWFDAVEKYGELEAMHVVSDKWGCSTHEVKRKIKRWDNQWL
jgi:hypothetical protein